MYTAGIKNLTGLTESMAIFTFRLVLKINYTITDSRNLIFKYQLLSYFNFASKRAMQGFEEPHFLCVRLSYSFNFSKPWFTKRVKKVL